MIWPEGVYSRLEGGLGNQLFMYAFSRALSLELQVPLFLDSHHGFERDHRYRREYRLDNFKIKGTLLKKAHPFVGFEEKRPYRWLKKVSKILPLSISPLLEEERVRAMGLESLVCPRRVIVMGYWQSERWFLPHRIKLLEDFRATQELGEKALTYLQGVSSCDSVAIHFRLVDFKDVLDVKYYHKAIEILKEKLGSFRVYVFSDSPLEAVKTGVLKDLDYTMVETDNEIDDFQLMSLCHHQITANSSFSWWAAWLNSRDGKKVFAPQEYGFPIEIPESWLTLSS